MARYNDFKSYIQSNYAEYLSRVVFTFVNEKHDGLGFHSYSVLSLCKQEIENLSVKSLRCNDMPGPFVKIDVNLTADIVMLGLGTKKYEADRKTRWFTVHIVANINNGMVIDESKTSTEEYAPGTFDKTTALDEFLVPYVYTADLEDIADDFTLFYCQDAIYGPEEPYAFPYWHVLQQMEIDAYEADLPEMQMGRMYFKKSTVTVYKKSPMIGEQKYEDAEIHPGTMLISKNSRFMHNTQSAILTIAHEIVHWYYHQKFFKILSLLDDQSSMMPCDVEPQKYDEEMTSLQKARWFVEWQANAIGMRIALPQELFVQAMREVYSEQSKIPQKGSFTAEVLEATLEIVGNMFGVSKFVAKQRAIQLGLDAAAGTMIYIDGHYHRPFSFAEGILGQKQTFVIDKDSLDGLCREDKVLSDLIVSGQFIYLGYVVCINDKQYVEKKDPKWMSPGEGEYDLTEYARDHVDECCLIFDWDSISGKNDDGGFYGLCYLSKDVSAQNRIEHTYNPDFECNQDTMALAKQIAKYKAAFAAEEKVLRELPRTFPDQLIYHMDRKNITVEALAFQSNLSTTTIKKYRAGTSRPDLDNIMAVFIGLNLPEIYCDQMLDACGLALKDMDLKQKVYRVLIREHSDGNLYQWNKILRGFNLESIPNRRNQKISV